MNPEQSCPPGEIAVTLFENNLDDRGAPTDVITSLHKESNALPNPDVALSPKPDAAVSVKSSQLHKRFLKASVRAGFSSRRSWRSSDASVGESQQAKLVSLIPEDVEMSLVKLVPVAGEEEGQQRPSRILARQIEENICSYEARELKPRSRRYKKLSPRPAYRNDDDDDSARQQKRLPQRPFDKHSDFDDEQRMYTKTALTRPKSQCSTRSAYDEYNDDYLDSRYLALQEDRMVRSFSRMSDREGGRVAKDYDLDYRRYRPKSAQPEFWESHSDTDSEKAVHHYQKARTKRTDYKADPRVTTLFQYPAWRHYLNEHRRVYGFFPTYEQLQYYERAGKQAQKQPIVAALPGGGGEGRPAVGASDTSCRTAQVAEPYLYSRAHSIATFGTGGRLIVLDLPRSAKALPTVVEVRNVRSYIANAKLLAECKVMEMFPGPLDVCSTARDHVLQYCTKRVERLNAVSEHRDNENMILLLHFFALMVRQNGMVNGKDLAHMLLECGSDTPLAGEDFACEQEENGDQLVGGTSDSDNDFVIPSRAETNGSKVVLTKAVQTINMAEREFTRLLLRGYKKEALDWAIKTQLWGHALFLAMKMSRHTHMTVMTRFANSLPIDSPLQTLYQMLSGGVPYSSTRLPDKSWREWRSHLAMILANLSLEDEQMAQRELYGVLTMGNTLLNVGQIFGAQFCYICCQLLANWNIFETGNEQQPAARPLVDLVGLEGGDGGLEKRTGLPVFNYVLTELLEYTIALNCLHSKNCAFWIIPLKKYKMQYAVRLAELGFAEEALAYGQVLAKTVSYELAVTGALGDLGFVANLYEFALQYHRFNPELELLESSQQTVPEWLSTLGSLCNSAKTCDDQTHFASGNVPTSVGETKRSGSIVPIVAHVLPPVERRASVESSFVATAYLQSTEATAATSFERVEHQPQRVVAKQAAAPTQPTGRDPIASGKLSASPAVERTASSSAEAQSWIGKTMGGLIQKFIPKGPNQMILPDDSQKTIVWDKERERWVDMTDPGVEEAEPLAPPPAIDQPVCAASLTESYGGIRAQRYVNVMSSGDQPTNQSVVAPPMLSNGTQPTQSYWIPQADGTGVAASPFTENTDVSNGDAQTNSGGNVPFVDPSSYAR